MNMKHVLTLLALALPAGSAPPPPAPVDAVGQWLADRVMKAAERDAVHGAAQEPAEGVYRLMPLAELDAPEVVKQHFREQIQRSRAGVIPVERGSIPSEQRLLWSLPRARRSDSVLRQRLPNPPSTLQGTLLGAAALIGMEPTGAISGVKSSGLSRFYHVARTGIVEFNEENFRVPGGVIEAFVEAQNTTINGTPGQIEMTADDQGRSQVVLSWAGNDKVYTLTATGEGDVHYNARVLHAIARSIKD